jgi:Flp pilus assembly protein TadD
MMTQEPIHLIVTALSAGQLSEAERLCQAELLERPHDQDLLLLHAMTLQFQQRRSEALAIYFRLTELFSGSSAHWCNYATALVETGSLNEAANAYATAIRLDPRNPAPKIYLGLMLIQRQDFFGARDMLLDAFELDRDSPAARIHAARACCLCQDFQGAEDLLGPWRTWLPLNDTPLQLELAKLLLMMSDASDAAMVLEDLISRMPSHLEPRLQLAYVYERLNRLNDAEALAQSVAEAGVAARTEVIDNELDHVFATLALRNGDAAKARSLLERRGPRQVNDYAHYFELGRVYDKLHETELAMEVLRTAHALQVEELKVASPDHFEPDALAMPAAIQRVSTEDYAKWPRLIAPDTRTSPVFIVGFPRSGTTLLEQMLDAHPSLQSMDENPFFNRLAEKLRRHDPRIMSNLDLLQQRDCDELRKQYLIMVSEKVNRRWSAQLVDKNPLNMMWMPMIYRLFPDARFILALRHPCDVMLSCYMQNFRSSIVGAACSSLERMAHAYVQAMETWLEDERIFQPSVLVSRYEDLVADSTQQTSCIAQFLDLEDATPMLKFDQHARNKGYIGTPSYAQVIEPVNTKGLNRWTRYRREFESVLPIIEPMLRHWGYSAETSG